MIEGTRLHRLRAYIDAAQTAPAVWGESDCCAWPLRWAAQERGYDLHLPVYHTREEAHSLIAAAGDLETLASSFLTWLSRAWAPEPGDIGIVRMSVGDVGVIFCPGGIAAWRRDSGGVLLMKPRSIVVAWSV